MVADDICAVQNYLPTQFRETTHLHADRVGLADVQFVDFLVFGLEEDWYHGRIGELLERNGAVSELLVQMGDVHLRARWKVVRTFVDEHLHVHG